MDGVGRTLAGVRRAGQAKHASHWGHAHCRMGGVARHAGAWRQVRRRAGGRCFFSISVVVLPWTAANYHATGGVIPVTDADGYSFWLGNHPLNLDLYQGRLTSAEHSKLLTGFAAPEAISAGGGSAWYNGLTIPERAAFWRAAGWAHVIADPSRALKIWAHKAWGYWQPWLQPFGYSLPAVLASGFVMVGLYVLAFRGLLGARRRPETREAIALFAALAIASTGVHVLSLSSIRYRLPYIDPLRMVFAALALAEAWEALAARRRRLPAGP